MDGDWSEKESAIVASTFSCFDSSPNENAEAWKPWRKGLGFKVLGRNISFHILEQKLRELWMLNREFEMTNLKGGYYIVRFMSKSDCHKVLDERS